MCLFYHESDVLGLGKTKAVLRLVQGHAPEGGSGRESVPDGLGYLGVDEGHDEVG